MGNVASWSGTKTLTCFEYYDQAITEFFNPGENKFHSNISVNWASLKNTSTGLVIDPPTTRGPFKNIEKDGYPSQHKFYPFSGKDMDQNFLIMKSFFRLTKLQV